VTDDNPIIYKKTERIRVDMEPTVVGYFEPILETFRLPNGPVPTKVRSKDLHCQTDRLPIVMTQPYNNYSVPIGHRGENPDVISIRPECPHSNARLRV
jgi:hypothetical protein